MNYLFKIFIMNQPHSNVLRFPNVYLEIIVPLPSKVLPEWGVKWIGNFQMSTKKPFHVYAVDDEFCLRQMLMLARRAVWNS